VLRLEHHYVAAQNRYPNYNFEIALIDNNNNNNNNIVNQILDISTPPAAYHLCNAYTSISPINNFEIMLSVNNLTNTVYRDYLNRMRYYANDLGRNFVVGIKYKF
jgi:iron complex outermembrane receptor protein